MQVFSSAPQSCIFLLLIVILNENFRARIIQFQLLTTPSLPTWSKQERLSKLSGSRILAKSRVGSLTSHKNQNDNGAVIQRQGLRFFHLIREDQNFSPFLDARTIAERHSPQFVHRLPKKDSLFTSIQALIPMVRWHQF